MAYLITSASKGISAINMTCKDGTKVFDVAYFNQLFNTDDCVITEVHDGQVISQENVVNATEQAVMADNAEQIQANRMAFIDALMSGDTDVQEAIKASQINLLADKPVDTKSEVTDVSL